MRQTITAGLLLALAGTWMATAAAPRITEYELREKAQREGVDYEALQAEYGHLLPGAEDAAADDPRLGNQDHRLYYECKLRGDEAPESLRRRLFPHAGASRRDVSRDGGDGPEDATEITTVAWGDCYDDDGTTADKTDVMPSPVEEPLFCNFDLYTSSFSAPDAWYTFTLQDTTYIEATTCLEFTTFDTAFGIFDEQQVPVAVDDDESCDWDIWRSTMECCLEPGAYYLVIDGYSDDDMGDYQINICFDECPPHPCVEYTEDTQAVDAPLVILGDNVGAPHVYAGDGGDAGCEITIPVDGHWDFDACRPGTSYSVDLYLFDINPCAGGTVIAQSTTSNCNEPFAAARLMEVLLEEGVYHLLVGHTGTSEGDFEILVQATPPRPTSGGPDEFGYAWINSENEAGPLYEWVDILDLGTAVVLTDDDFEGPLPLGFTFPFYEESYADCYICSNGYVSFGQGYTTYTNTTIPFHDGWSPDNMIAPFWDDLNPASGGQILYYFDEANGRFIVQYDQVPPFGAGGLFTFQVILYENGDIRVNYEDMDEGDVQGATVGIENADGSIGLLVNYDGEGGMIADQLALDFLALEGDWQPPIIVHDPLPDVEAELAGGIALSAEITDESGVAEASLHWLVDGESGSAALTNTGGDTWEGEIPHQDEGSMVAYYLTATDASENSNVRTSPTWSFEVVSYAWPPQNLVATDGMLSQTLITWLPPVDPGLLARWFGPDLPTREDEAVERLMEIHGVDRAAAWRMWERLARVGDGQRVFQYYYVYRDGEAMGTTTELLYSDNLGEGSEPEVTYTYHVTAVFDAGESDPSNTDDGWWLPTPTEGGPDEFGYVWIHSDHPEGPDFDWTDISGTGTELTLGLDDFAGPIATGFTFPFYDSNYTECYICSNGYVSFGQGYTAYINEPIPQPGNGWSPDNMVAVFWDDMDMPHGGSAFYWYDEENDRFIVQYHEVVAYPGGGPPMTYQTILYPEGDILCQYLDMDENDVTNATVGIENADGTIGLQVNFDGDGGRLGDGVAIYFDALEGDFQPPVIVHDPLPDVETEIEGGFEVEAQITDNTGVAEASVHWFIDGENGSAAMENTGGDAWTGAIPHQDAGTIVQYHIEAVDASENSNVRVSPTWEFEVVSYTWPPVALSATDGLLLQTIVTWLPPVDPGLLARWFGGAIPSGEDDALMRLMREHGLDKERALLLWRGLLEHSDHGRVFQHYLVYRDGEEIGSTTELTFIDDAGQGSEMDVVYEYHVTALFDAGESEASNSDTGYWGSPPTQGGPDDYGYTWINSLDPIGPPYDWVDISGTGDLAVLSDDSFDGPFAMGIEFPFYEQFWSECYVGSNGFISFGEGSGSLSNTELPNDDGWSPNNLIAMFWDDLDPPEGAGAAYTYADAENDRFIVQFDQVEAYPGGAPSFTFQAILEDNGRIMLYYQDMNEGDLNSATIGVENSDGTIGLQINYNGEGGAIADLLAIRIDPPNNCEPVECAGTAEEEPNQGWFADPPNSSYGEIEDGETICGEVLADGATWDTDWFHYLHFGGDLRIQTEVSDFDCMLSLYDFDPQDGELIATVDDMERCWDETLFVNGLESGDYLVMIAHNDFSGVDTLQTYALMLNSLGDPCEGHQPVDCQGTPESEPNEGWNADPPNSSFNEIVEGETVCGEVWAEEGLRDMDWYRFELFVPTMLDFVSEVDEFNCVLFLTDFDPEGVIHDAVDIGPMCYGESLGAECLDPGVYYIVIAHNETEGVGNPQAYALTFNAESCVENGPCDHLVEAGELEDVYNAERPAPIVSHHDAAAGCPGDLSSPGFDEIHQLVLLEDTDIRITHLGEGQADEVILVLGDCEHPETTCGAAVDDQGAGADGEELEVPGLPAGDYYIVADYRNPGETAPYSIMVLDLNSSVVEHGRLRFELRQNFPNPFNPVTLISWTQPSLARATLSIHNILGERVREIDLGYRGAGLHKYAWNAADLGSGVYIYTLSSAGRSETRKAVLLR